MALAPGIHDLSAADYHADPCERPSLSAHTIHTLLTRSPLHAWTQHARLNPDYERTERDSFDLGTAVHDLWLRGTTDTVAVVESNDWRTKYAQEQKAEARALGRVPLLAKDWIRVREMTDAIREQLDQRYEDPPLFGPGKPEQTLVWEEQGVTCRALVDWLHDDHAALDDLKTTSASANPHAWCRTTMWNIGADIQLAFHSRGLKALTGQPHPLFRFVVVECQPPYALSAVTLNEDALTLANEKIDRALETWKRCLATDTWPAYTHELIEAKPPPWAEGDWLERQAIEDLAA